MYLEINLDRVNIHKPHIKSYKQEINFLLNGAEIRDGDVIIIKGGETIFKDLSLYLLKKYADRQVDFIFESYFSELFKKDVLEIIKTYRSKIKEIRTHLFFENNINLFIGDKKRFHDNLTALKDINFTNISIITTISTLDYNQIKGILDYIEKRGLKHLYIRFEENTPIGSRIKTIRDLTERFKDDHRIIIENNGFMMRMGDKKDPVEIRSDPTSSTVNMVIRNLCTSNCIFCTTRIVSKANNAPLPYDSKTEIIRALRSSVKDLKDVETLEIVAVEPLEHPFIIDILMEAADLGFSNIKLLTHGRLLYDRDLLGTLMKNRVKEITIPVIFYSAESAAFNAGDKNHYYDIVRVFENIQGLKKIKFTFNVIISKRNYKDIQKIYEFIRGYGFENINFTLALPSIEDERFYLPYGVRFSDILNVVNKIDNPILKKSLSYSLLYYIPPCLFVRYFGNNWGNIIREKIKNNTHISIASRGESARPKSTVKCNKADRCPYGEYCIGLNTIYVKVFGDEEFL